MPTPRERANAIRALAMDAVQKANSGHPGMPLGMADIAEVLWHDFLNHNPRNPKFYNRDRFILSNGHGCMLQYALLHLTSYDVSLEDIKHFRQLHSKTPGHPEYGITPGVESTTGPLGQGLGHAVGMALAEKRLAAQFNRENFPIIDHYTYVFLGDGCLMEGVSHEVCSLAGLWKLNKLIAFWDNNQISIDGKVSGWFMDDTPARFRAYGWHVIDNIDGHDAEKIKQAIQQAHAVADKPVLICCQTIIGFGSPNKAGSCDVHGAPLGENEIMAAKKALNWPYTAFEIPEAIYQAWNAQEKGDKIEAQWQQLFQAYQTQFPELGQELMRRLQGNLPEQFSQAVQESLLETAEKAENIATRKASQNCINLLDALLPELLGGSADLTHSNLTLAKNAKDYIYYGVREFGMSAIMCGIALHGGFIPFGGTFLTFSDYARNAVRLSALMKIHVIYIYTHDSIGLGEDGPTHQPVEHLAMLRLTPGLSVWRPCDAVETLVAWQQAILHRDKPTCLILSRQNLAAQAHPDINAIKHGAYILQDTENPEVILIATGSEVALAMDAAKLLNSQSQKRVRVVSMPSVDVFLAQDKLYQEKILPAQVKKRVAIEASATPFWRQFVGLEGAVIGLDRFGESAPAADIYNAVGITVENIIQAVLQQG